MIKQIIIVGIIILLFCVGFSGCTEHMGTNVNNEIQVLNHNIKEDNSFKAVYGTIKNIADKDIEEVTVKIRFYDIGDKLLWTETTTVNHLAKGGTGNFTVTYWYYEPYFDEYDHYTVSVST